MTKGHCETPLMDGSYARRVSGRVGNRDYVVTYINYGVPY